MTQQPKGDREAISPAEQRARDVFAEVCRRHGFHEQATNILAGDVSYEDGGQVCIDAMMLYADQPTDASTVGVGAIPEGYVLVPVEPTEAMWRASTMQSYELFAVIWAQALAAAPATQSPAIPAGVDRDALRTIEILSRALAWHGDPQRMATTREEWQQTVDDAIVWVKANPEPDRPSFSSFATPSQPSGADQGEVARLDEAKLLLEMLVAADDDQTLLDQIDYDGTPYRSTAMEAIIVHAKAWLRPNSPAECMAAYRAALAPKAATAQPGEGIVAEVVAMARRDIARTQTDFLGRMAQCLCTYEGIFDEHPDGELPADVKEDADDAITGLAALALAQVAMLRFPAAPSAALTDPTTEGEIP